MIEGWSFNPPPGWPAPPRDWTPPPDWVPAPEWGPLPPGWQLWVATPSRRPGASAAGTAGLIALAVAAMTWLPRMSGTGPGTSAGSAGSAEGEPGSGVRAAVVGAVPRFPGCDALTEVYPHGVGRPGAVDRPAVSRDARRSVLGSWSAVTDFGRSTALYGANRDLDTDRDGIACER